MPHYKKDINYIVPVAEVEEMIRRGSPRDQFIVAVLYLTGCRTWELLRLEKDNIKDIDNAVFITLKTAKLGKSKSFTINERTLEFSKYAWSDRKICCLDICSYHRARSARNR